jgi:hypothetical protein
MITLKDMPNDRNGSIKTSLLDQVPIYEAPKITKKLNNPNPPESPESPDFKSQKHQ